MRSLPLYVALFLAFCLPGNLITAENIVFLGGYQIEGEPTVLLDVDNRSIWMRIGNEFDGVRLLSVARDFESVDVEANGVHKTLPIADGSMHFQSITQPTERRFSQIRKDALDGFRKILEDEGATEEEIAVALADADHQMERRRETMEFLRSIAGRASDSAMEAHAREQADKGNLFVWKMDEAGRILGAQLILYPYSYQLDPESGEVVGEPHARETADAHFEERFEAFMARFSSPDGASTP